MTPDLTAGNKHYTVMAVIDQGGRSTTVERQVAVSAGRTVVVDFTKAAPAGNGR